MKFSESGAAGSANGIASLAILKMLLDILQKKNVLTKEEIDIILNCAEVEVENADSDTCVTEAKSIIENIFNDSETEKGDTTNY